jgi:hypothetical protein
MMRTLGALAVLFLSGCGAGEEVVASPQVVSLDLSARAREEAVVDAVKVRFNQLVREPFLDRGMTVRGLARAATRSGKPVAAKTAAELNASRYDPAASSSAKIEIIAGKVIYTTTASADDASAAVIGNDRERWAVSYEVEAAVTPDGELENFVFRRLGTPTRLD